MGTRRRFLTIGHGTRSAEELVRLLMDAGAKKVVDVRRFPRSRTNPQFNSEVFAKTLARAGLGYRHAPELGGRRGRARGPDDVGDLNTGWQVQAFRNYADYALTSEFEAALRALRAENALEAPLAARLMTLRFPLHIGSLGGLATRLLAVLTGFFPAGLFFTGFFLWLARTRAAAAPARRAALMPSREGTS